MLNCELEEIKRRKLLMGIRCSLVEIDTTGDLSEADAKLETMCDSLECEGKMKVLTIHPPVIHAPTKALVLIIAKDLPKKKKR